MGSRLYSVDFLFFNFGDMHENQALELAAARVGVLVGTLNYAQRETKQIVYLSFELILVEGHVLLDDGRRVGVIEADFDVLIGHGMSVMMKDPRFQNVHVQRKLPLVLPQVHWVSFLPRRNS